MVANATIAKNIFLHPYQLILFDGMAHAITEVLLLHTYTKKTVCIISTL